MSHMLPQLFMKLNEALSRRMLQVQPDAIRPAVQSGRRVARRQQRRQVVMLIALRTTTRSLPNHSHDTQPHSLPGAAQRS